MEGIIQPTSSNVTLRQVSIFLRLYSIFDILNIISLVLQNSWTCQISKGIWTCLYIALSKWLYLSIIFTSKKKYIFMITFVTLRVETISCVPISILPFGSYGRIPWVLCGNLAIQQQTIFQVPLQPGMVIWQSSNQQDISDN